MRHLLFILLATAILSCDDDDNTIETPAELFGTWDLTEICHCYVGGNNEFQSANDTYFFEFEENGIITTDLYTPACTGTYNYLSDDTIEFSFPCNNSDFQLKLTLLDNTELILDEQVIEGVVRNKFSKR